ncbi:ArnT family glycosyltransferase [Chlamydiota bacterium]
MQHAKYIWLIVIISFIIRLMLGLIPSGNLDERLTRPDSIGYIRSAQILTESFCYREGKESMIPQTRYPCGYPLFLAVFFKMHNSLLLPVIFTCLLSALICIPIYRAGLLFGNPFAGCVGAILYALNITSISSAPLILSDTIFAFLVAWQFLFFIKFYKNEHFRDLLIAVAFNGLSVFFRTTGFLWILPCFVFLVFFKRWTFRKRLAGIVLSALLFMLIVVPWMARNSAVGAGFRIEPNIGDTLYYHNAAALMSVVSGVSAEELRQEWRTQSENEFRDNSNNYLNESEKVEYKLKKAKEIIAQHPLQYIRLHIQPMILVPDAPTFLELIGMTQTGRGTLDIFRREGFFAAVNHYFNNKIWLLPALFPFLIIVAGTYIACGVQLIRWLIEKQLGILWIFFSMAVYFLVLPGPIVMPRYQLPALPMICFTAGLGISWIYNLVQTKPYNGVS